MAPSAPQTFKGISPEKYALLTEKAKGAGIDMEGNSGTASKFGVEMQWNYSLKRRNFRCSASSTPSS